MDLAGLLSAQPSSLRPSCLMLYKHKGNWFVVVKNDIGMLVPGVVGMVMGVA